MRGLSFFSLAFALAFVQSYFVSFINPASASPKVKVNTELSQSVLLKNKKQKTYLRVHLEGERFQKTEERTPVNVAIVIDKSGSMRGEKMAQAKEAALMAIDRLASADVISVVSYSRDAEVVIPASQVDDNEGMGESIRALRADGNTALYAGVKTGISQLREFLSRNRVNRVILISDGLANVGPSTPEALGKLGREAAQEGISITTIGLGLGYNEDLMAKLAFNSDGNHAFVEEPSDLVKIFNNEFGDVLSVIAQDIDIEIEFPEGVRPIRSLGREVKIDKNNARFRLNQMYGSQKREFLLELDVTEDFAKKHDKVDLANIKLRYLSMATKSEAKDSQKVSVEFSTSDQTAKDSENKTVMTSVVRQIAIEKNEKAVKLRDRGQIEQARKVLNQNAIYLKQQSKKLSSKSLNELSKSNADDAKNLSGPNWNRSRKSMKARQHRSKTQQSY